MSPKNSVYILSIDAKDLYDAMHLKVPSETGYDVRDRDGQLRYNRFINVLDYSLELIHLRQVYKQVMRNNRFSEWLNGKEYTQQVINVTFKYSYKEWNRCSRTIEGREHIYFVRAGYRFCDLEFSDCLAYMDGELVGVETEVPVEKPLTASRMPSAVFYDDEGYHIRASENTTLRTREELRRDIYEKGFVCDGAQYVRFKRSSGSARIGKCLFINEKLYSRMHMWEKCGLTVRPGAKIDLASWEAYISLTMSSIIDTLELKPENILLIDDYDSVFRDKMLAVGLEGTWLTAQPQEREMSNCIWDGQSLLDSSMFRKYPTKGMLLLRTRFFKSACFNTDIQGFFRDKGITDVSQLRGQTRAKRVEDIKLITTPASVKYLKFGKFDEWLDRLEPEFGIVKYDKPTRYFGGKMVQTHYQLLNTLHMSKEDVRELLKPSQEYLDKLDSDPAVLRHHLKMNSQVSEFTPTNVMNDVVFYFLGVNDKFFNTQLCHKFRQRMIGAYKSNLKKGHVLVHGTYATLFSNPYEMLLSSVGMFDGKTTIQPNTVSCSMFKEGARLLGSRSPHVAAGNILVTDNVVVPEIERYFNLTPQIVCINSIEDNILERLSGADMDSDTMLLTDEPLLVNRAEKHYQDFLVPTKLVPAKNTVRHFTSGDKANLDHVTAGNKIGEIVNLSQELNSLFWDRLNQGASFEDLEDIYCDIAKLDVLSNIEIDRAKRECVVSATAEMKKMRKKYMMRDKDKRKVKPFFFAHIARRKGYYNAKRNYYKHHNTTMDYVQEEVSTWRRDRQTEFAPLGSIFRVKYYSPKYVKEDVARSMLQMIRDTNALLRKYWGEWREADKDARNVLYQRIQELMDNRASYINDCSLGASTIYYTLQEIEKEENSDIRNLFFRILFGSSLAGFQQLIQESADGIPLLEEDEKGEVELFGRRYAKRVSETFKYTTRSA